MKNHERGHDAMTAPVITLDKVSFSYGEVTALENICQ